MTGLAPLKPPATPDEAWLSWKEDPTPERMAAAVDTLKPTLDVMLYNVGGAADPVLRSKARTLAAKAISTYDPDSGAALPTWTSQNLQRLSRIKRQSDNPVHIPERMQLENYQLERSRLQFLDTHDREPDVQELSDAAKLSVRRIAEIRSSMRRMPSEGALNSVDGTTTIGETTLPDYLPEAVDIVYDDLDHIDRRILEMKTGHGGSDILSPQEVARKLKLTAPELSRRSARISLRIRKAEADLADI